MSIKKDKLLDKITRWRLKIHNTVVNNYEIIVDKNNLHIAKFEDFTSPINDDVGYCDVGHGIGKKEKKCELNIYLENIISFISVFLNADLASKVFKCQENPKNKIFCCLTKDYKNLDFLCFNGKKYTPLFRISLVKSQNTENTECIGLDRLLVNDEPVEFRVIALYYWTYNDFKYNDFKYNDFKCIDFGYPFKEYLTTSENGRIADY